MRLRIVILAICFNLMENLLALHYDYEISRGRKMWSGSERAVHYLNHFKVLTTKMSGIKGFLSSTFPFQYDKEWSLTFELKQLGDSNRSKDGFLLMLSEENISFNELKEQNDSSKVFLDVLVS